LTRNPESIENSGFPITTLGNDKKIRCSINCRESYAGILTSRIKGKIPDRTPTGQVRVGMTGSEHAIKDNCFAMSYKMRFPGEVL
jgi:hypothetical protein